MNHHNTTGESQGLLWPRLTSGILIKRYKRFLADVKLANGDIITAHCANSGTMKECSQPGRAVYLSYHDNPKRKLKYTWELIDMPTSLVGVNTMVPNRLVKKSIELGMVDELSGYEKIKPEVTVAKGSRLDLLLTGKNGDTCFVEIKNCTLVQDQVASFPDAVTNRGKKHLVELQKLVSKGHRCVMFFLVQRMDADYFRPADAIDPAYAGELRRADRNGVELLAYDVLINLEKIILRKKVPIILN
ncbi:MAG: sugar fermentation stimulation protein SfsA [Desulfobacteraceae bacterium 4572_123]|nr:MAG: sugar fermentation stimulation protein SfsA [Desulfobacteraceae bacterium 4572_123]